MSDFNPGITENGVFWIIRAPSEGDFDIEDPERGRARLAIKNLAIEDYHDIANALIDGPTVPAQVSFDCSWKDPIATTEIRNPAPDQRFAGRFTHTHATLEWSAEEKGFSFHSDPAPTSTALWAEVGRERNGRFFS